MDLLKVCVCNGVRMVLHFLHTSAETKYVSRGEPSDLQPPIPITPLPRFDTGTKNTHFLFLYSIIMFYVFI